MKEKNNNFFTHKFLPIVIIFMLCLFVLCTSCFASYDLEVQDRDDNSYIFTINDELLSQPYFYVFYYKTTTSYRTDVLAYYSSNYELYFNNGTLTCNLSIVPDDFYIKHYSTALMSYHSPFATEIEKFNDLTIEDLPVATYGSYSSTYIQLGSCVYANVDLKDLDGNVVFQGAPQKVEQVTIPAIQQAEEIPQAMTEVMKILLPIGLIVLSIGLVIYLTRLVISRLA